MASIYREVDKKGKVTYKALNEDNPKLKKGQTLVTTGIDKAKAWDLVVRGNKGDGKALGELGNLSRIEEAKARSAEATKANEQAKATNEYNDAVARSNLDMNRRAEETKALDELTSNKSIMNEVSSTTPQALTESQVQTASEHVSKEEARQAGERAAAGTLGTGGTSEEQKQDLLEGTNGADKTKHPEEVEKGYEEAKNPTTPEEKAYTNIMTTANTPTTTTIPPVHNTESNTESKTEEAIDTPESIDSPEEAKAVEKEITENPDKLSQFWNAFKAGAFAAYPYLQAIAQSISNNARMTLDRAALLTGGTRDLDAYNAVNPNDYKDQNYDTQMAILSAKAGNMDNLATLVANGSVTLEDAAVALNMTPEDLQERFSQTKRANEADTTNKELTNEEVVQRMSTDTERMLSELREEQMHLEEARNALAGHAYDAYRDAVEALRGSVEGVKNVGSAYTTSSDNTNNANAAVQSRIINIGGGASWSDAMSSTATSSVDEVLLHNLDAILKEGREAMADKDKANEELIASIDKQIRQIEQRMTQLQNRLNRVQGKTRLDYAGGSNANTSTNER